MQGPGNASASSCLVQPACGVHGSADSACGCACDAGWSTAAGQSAQAVVYCSVASDGSGSGGASAAPPPPGSSISTGGVVVLIVQHQSGVEEAGMEPHAAWLSSPCGCLLGLVCAGLSVEGGWGCGCTEQLSQHAGAVSCAAWHPWGAWCSNQGLA